MGTELCLGVRSSFGVILLCCYLQRVVTKEYVSALNVQGGLCLWRSLIVHVYKMSHIREKSPRWVDLFSTLYVVVCGFLVTRLVIIHFYKF